MINNDKLVIGGHEFNSRFILGSGKYSLSLIKAAVENAGAEIIMLDNMSHDTMKEAIALIGDRAETEISGNVTEENVAQIKDLGADYVSSGALTHSAPILDLSLKNLHPVD